MHAAGGVMSSFTDRLYMTWLNSNGCQKSRSGYGAEPHGKRRAGYPLDQRTLPKTHRPMRSTRPMRDVGATSRDVSLRATDAAPRHEKQDVQNNALPFFLP